MPAFSFLVLPNDSMINTMFDLVFLLSDMASTVSNIVFSLSDIDVIIVISSKMEFKLKSSELEFSLELLQSYSTAIVDDGSGIFIFECRTLYDTINALTSTVKLNTPIGDGHLFNIFQKYSHHRHPKYILGLMKLS
jgi:hypothetical protein